MTAARSAAAAVVAVALAAGMYAPGAGAATTSKSRRICVGPTLVRDTPGGITIGILAKDSPVRVLMHAAKRRDWVRIHASPEIAGWIKASALCP